MIWQQCNFLKVVIISLPHASNTVGGLLFRNTERLKCHHSTGLDLPAGLGMRIVLVRSDPEVRRPSLRPPPIP